MDIGYQNVDGHERRRFTKFKVGGIGAAVLTGCALLWLQGPRNTSPTQDASEQPPIMPAVLVDEEVHTMPADEEDGEEVSVEPLLDDSQLGAVDNVWGITEEEYALVFGKDGPHPDHIANLRNHKAAAASVPANSTELEALHGGVDVDSDTNSHAIYQGELGDCYFDAALAAIAHTHQNLIKSKFVSIDLKRGVFKTKWFVAGKWVTVSVNAEVPTDPRNGVPYFLWTSSELTLWPSILEKAYAKLVGNYKDIESGNAGEAMQYLLGAPITKVPHSALTNMFPTIKAAVAAAQPMGIGTGRRGGYHGIDGGHEYTLYDASDNYKGYGRAVRVRNPWGHNRYTGYIKGQSQSIGDFWITWDEFLRNYDRLYIANLKVGYNSVFAGSIPVSGNSIRQSVSVQVSSDNDFEIMVLAPSSRIAKAAGCTLRGGRAYIGATSPSGRRVRGGFDGSRNGLVVKGKGRGKWSVTMSYSGVFQNLPEFVVSVYTDGTASAGRAMTLTELPADLIMENNSDIMLSEPPLPEPTELYGCTSYVQRLRQLNNNPMPTDRMFPDTSSSIARPGVYCGDDAQGLHKACSTFNHWKSAIVVADAMNDGLKCLSFTHVGGKCRVQNSKCDKPAMLFCKTMKCRSQGSPIAPNHHRTLDPGCCTCNDPRTFR